MSRESDTHTGVVIMAFVMGAITGAATALLMTPATGGVTRGVLNDRTREGREKIGKAAREGVDFFRRERGHLSTAIDRGREAYQRARDTEQATAEEQG